MKKLLNLLLQQYPLVISHTSLEEIMNENELNKLLKLGVLKENKQITSIACSNCGNSNDVLFDRDDKPYCVCSCENGGKVSLDEKDIKRYELQVEKLLNNMLGNKSKDFHLKEEKLWSIGERTIQNQKFTVYFYLGANEDILDLLNNVSPYVIIFYFGKNTIKDNSVFFISTLDILENGMTINFELIEDYTLSNIRFIEFTKEGRILLYKKEIANVAYPSPQYFFFEYLYNNFGEWKTNDEIYRHVQNETKKKTGHGYILTHPQEFSKSMVREIKRNATDKKAIARIIQNNKKTGYRINNPS